jgi:hypothetical protein
LKEIFHITNSKSENTQQVLSLRLGEKHACFSISNKSAKLLHELVYCTSNEINETELAGFFSAYPVLNNPFHQILIASDSSYSSFIPSDEYTLDEAGQLVNNIAGAKNVMTVITEPVPGWQLQNAYTVPSEIQELLTKKFPAANYFHHYSICMKNIPSKNIDGCLLVDFRNEEFTVLAARQKELVLAQSYVYSTPEDVLYYLLRIVKQFSLSQQTVQIQLSGLVDKESALYKELYQYFLHIEFRDASWSMPSEEFPLHYFTSLNELAKCAL